MRTSNIFVFAGLVLALICLSGSSAKINDADDDDVEIETEPMANTGRTSDRRESVGSADDEKSAAGDDAAADDDVDALSDLVDDALMKPSKDAETMFVFAEPTIDMQTRTIPTQEQIRVLIGVRNRGKKRALYMDAVQASLRYPMDFNYAVQNFSLHPYRARQVLPESELTLEYIFSIHETLAGRPFGLYIYMNYHDDAMKIYRNTIFNDTITIADPSGGFDSETFFLYAMGAMLLVLGGIFLQQYLKSSKGRSSTVGQYLRSTSNRTKSLITTQRSTSGGSGGGSKAYERGTSSGGVDKDDSDWLPVNTYNFVNQSPKTSPKKSPRARVRP